MARLSRYYWLTRNWWTRRRKENVADILMLLAWWALLYVALFSCCTTPAHAQQTPTTALAQLAADSAKLHRIERMCLHMLVPSDWGEVPIRFVSVVDSERLEGESAADAGVRTCVAQSKSLQAAPGARPVGGTLFCASCEIDVIAPPATAAPEVTP